MVKPKKELLDLELQHLLNRYAGYIESEKPTNIYRYVNSISSLLENISPYLHNRLATESPEKFLFAEKFPYNIPESFREPLILLCQALDLKLVGYPILLHGEINSIDTYYVIGNKSNYQVLIVLFLGLLNTYERYIASKSNQIKRYNTYIRYHKKRSPHLVKYQPLKGHKIMADIKHLIKLKINYKFIELVKLKYEKDALHFKTFHYRKFKKSVNSIVLELLGPRWKDRIKESKTLKYYYGKKPFKIRNKWLNEITYTEYSNQSRLLKNALTVCKKPQIPKNLPPMPKHSRKPVGGSVRWLPKQYRKVEKNP